MHFSRNRHHTSRTYDPKQIAPDSRFFWKSALHRTIAEATHLTPLHNSRKCEASSITTDKLALVSHVPPPHIPFPYPSPSIAF
jgi:hypothetical protein